ncbi:MAG: hypothetical protein U1E76_17265 [Planctomycetota bacterium]
MKRLLPKLIVALLILAPLSYFVFTLLFFQPFEGEMRALQELVPKDVDYYVRKVNLTSDFTHFPVPRLYEQLSATREWKGFAESPTARALFGADDLDRQFRTLKEQLDPIPLDLLDDWLGRDMAFVGRLGRGGVPTWCVLGRASFKAKLCFEALTYALVRKLIKLPGEWEATTGFYRLFVPDAKQSFFLMRRQDVIAVGSDQQLMADIAETVDSDGSSSLGYVGTFNESVVQKRQTGDPVFDVFADLKRLFSYAQVTGITTTEASSYILKGIAQILDPRFVTDVAGVVDLNDNPIAKLRLQLDSKLIKEAKSGFYEGGMLPLQEGFQVLGNTFPERDLVAAGMLKCNVRQMLLLFEKSMDQDSRTLLGDLVREMARYTPAFNCSGTVDLVDRYLDPIVKDTVYFALRKPQTFKDPLTDKETIPYPWPSIALLFELEDQGPFDVLNEAIKNAQQQLKFKRMYDTRPYQQEGRPDLVFREARVEEALEIESICWGIIEDVDKKYLLVTTSTDLYSGILGLRYGLRPRNGVGTSATFRLGKPLLEEQKFANLFSLVDFQAVRKVVNDIVDHLARQQAAPDWTAERAKAQEEIVRTRYPRYRDQPLPPSVEQEVKQEVEQRMIELDTRYKTEVAPKEAEKSKANLAWLDLLRGAALTLRVNEGNMDLNTILNTAATGR